MDLKKPQASSRERGAYQSTLPFEAIVMAGGRGQRLSPLTDDCPKPLLKVGGRPIVEYSIRRLINAGVKDVTFCVNYLGEMIQDHFRDGKDLEANISYIFEPSPLGTIGGVVLKEDFIFEDILVINGDLLTTINFERFYAFYLEQDADLAIATIPYRINLPYGILDKDGEHEVRSIKEKPSYTHYINTGIYLMRKEMLDYIPRDKAYDAVELIDAAMENNAKVAAFTLLDYWIDIGQIDDYYKAQEDIQFLDL